MQKWKVDVRTTEKMTNATRSEFLTTKVVKIRLILSQELRPSLQSATFPFMKRFNFLHSFSAERANWVYLNWLDVIYEIIFLRSG